MSTVVEQVYVAEQVYAANPIKNILVMPVMISEGVFTDRIIPQQLQGLSYVYPKSGQRALIPHGNISKYLSARANDAIIGSIKLKEGEQVCSNSFMDLALEEGGKICICAGLAFRALQQAINVLTPDSIPQKRPFFAVGPNSHGSEEVFARLLSEGCYRLEDREHNEYYYTYQVSDRQSGKMLSIQVRPEIFPADFFKLKQKIKNGTATSEDKQAFKSLRAQVVEKVRWEDAGKLFSLIGPTTPGSGGGGGSSDTSSDSQAKPGVKTPEIQALPGKPVDVKAKSGAILNMGMGSINIPANATTGLISLVRIY